MESVNHMKAPYANALAISLLAVAVIVVGLKDQRCEKRPSRTTTTNQAAPSLNKPERPVVTQNRQEFSKF